MHSEIRILSLPLFLLLILFLTGCPCPDPTNPECDNYDPCLEDPTDPGCSEEEIKGRVIYEKITSTSLESNLVNENTERNISVYLPARYETEVSMSYPVLYLLHGFTSDHTTWYGGTASELYGMEGNRGINIKKMLDPLIENGDIEPMIVVCADNYNRFEGSWYTNSIVTGNWEDFMSQELVSYIDANYRTLVKPESRGIAGHSMGAEGAMRLAMKYPDVYGLVYAMSGALEYSMTYLDLCRDDIIAANLVDGYVVFLHPFIRSKLSRAVAYAPNPTLSPIPGELPLDENGTLIDSAWQKWLKHDPYTMLGEYSENLKTLKGIGFDSGANDDANIGCNNFSEALGSLGIDHLFESYDGDHLNKIPERMATKVLPFFSENLTHSR